ncbi:MAG: winged helix-turn-helix domain-containing protein [Rickettsiaceae bacterium]|nr:winged helix-turn-helix domain-containing protein [Rickettsiaceae bacterium]MCP5374665.1 winged helix-turn-helix domain-containing protein [Rickettsiaceae bacterium]MCP5378242.1 winged helix-turn-helix domain-containing protein [Rickettsiaceae bacterium]WPX98919.1 PhoB super family two-component system response regulator [Candidatus Megaera polyxenophila]
MSDKLPPKILVVEYDDQLNSTLCNTIERYWFNVIRARSAETALRLAYVNRPNAAIISSTLQDISAIEMAVRLKKVEGLQQIPIIFLINQDESVQNYNITNNDNFNKILFRPFTPNELMVTVKSLLRRSNPVFQSRFIKHKNITMDLSTYKVYHGQKQVHFGPTEFKMLQLFITNPNNTYSRRQIVDYVWGVEKEISFRTVDVHINRIRKMMDLNDGNQVIRTIRAAGYSLD